MIWACRRVVLVYFCIHLNCAGAQMLTLADAIHTYIRAKDGNRPHLLGAAFAEDATLRMIVRTGAISFPALSEGREAIAEILVRRFNQTYENVYTLCVGVPPTSDSETFACDWLVAMSEKQNGAVRVGCGQYDWAYSRAQAKISALSITIEAMEILPPEALEPVIGWVSALPYPWCDRPSILAGVPALPGVNEAVRFLRREALPGR